MSSLVRRGCRNAAALPSRSTTHSHQKRLGSFPVAKTEKIWWSCRWQVPGGQIMQSVSTFQQKILWSSNKDFFWRWFRMAHLFGNQMFIPIMMMHVVWLAMQHDAEDAIRYTNWW